MPSGPPAVEPPGAPRVASASASARTIAGPVRAARHDQQRVHAGRLERGQPVVAARRRGRQRHRVDQLVVSAAAAPSRSPSEEAPCTRAPPRRGRRARPARRRSSSPARPSRRGRRPATAGRRRARRRGRPRPPSPCRPRRRCPRSVRPAFSSPRSQRLEQDVEACRVDHERQPAVGDLADLLDRLRADGAEVDGIRSWTGLASSFSGLRALQRHAVLAALVHDGLARERGAHDLDVLARAAHGPLERDAVPALGDLRARHAEPEPEAPAREHVQRRGGHRRRGRLRARGSGTARSRARPAPSCAASSPSTDTASWPHASAIHTESSPISSASTARSTCSCGVNQGQ